MEPGYCPVTCSTSWASGSYAGDGYDCVHVGVSYYSSDYLDVATLIEGAGLSDGTFETGSLAVAWRWDHNVYYSPGNTGGHYGSGDWPQLTANMCICTGGPMYGACCDIYTGECTDNVELSDCLPDQFHYAQLCAELMPPCGVPGCCCWYPESGYEIEEPTEEFEANCIGRFVPGVLEPECDPYVFDPPCGELYPTGLLYCPTNPDNPTFRDALSAELLGSPVDYFDPRTATPTLDELYGYACVFTWVNYAYADNVAMGDVLADYVDMGGKVILGQRCLPTAGNYLGGRIMAEYCPATASTYGSDGYAGDAFMCTTIGVDSFSSSHFDQTTTYEWAFSNGTTINGYDFISMNPPWSVFYSPGNTGLDYTTGDVVQLVANLCICDGGPMYGACCDPYTGDCDDDVELMDCLPPLQVFHEEACVELDPPCGNPGCCCFPEDGETVTEPYEEYEFNCAGRFLPGVHGEDCVAEAFDPECGLCQACEHSVTLWANNGEDKVTRMEQRATNDPGSVVNSVWDGSQIHLFGARNEVVAFNLVLEAGAGAVANVSVVFDTLTGPGGGTIHSEPASGEEVFGWVDRPIELFYVRYLQIRGLSRLAYGTYDERHIPERLRRPWTGEGYGSGTWWDRPDADKFYPDIAVPLELETPFDIAQGQNQSIWVDVYIPPSAEPGLYQGTVTVRVDEQTDWQIPVNLTVWDFSLPDEPALKTMLFLGYGDINRRYLGEPWPSDPELVEASQQILDRHFQMAHRHRLSLIGDALAYPDDHPSAEWATPLDGTHLTARNG